MGREYTIQKFIVYSFTGPKCFLKDANLRFISLELEFIFQTKMIFLY